METQIRLAEWEVAADSPAGPFAGSIRGAHLALGGGASDGMSFRQVVLSSLAGIATMFVGSIAIVYRLTEVPAVQPRGGESPAPRPQAVAVAPPVVAPPTLASAPKAAQPARQGGTPADRFLGPRPPPAQGGQAASSPAKIKVKLRTDPDLNRGLHMGDSWLPSAAYTAHRGDPIVLQAKASVFDARGVKVAAAKPTWTAARPEIVAVSPGKGGQVELRVARPGRTEVSVKAGSVTKALEINAFLDAGALRAEVSQRL
jgi:hypothetical protein